MLYHTLLQCWALTIAAAAPKSESRRLYIHGDPMDYTYSPWNSAGQNTGVGSLSLLQGIFPTQGSNPGLPHCRPILYRLICVAPNQPHNPRGAQLMPFSHLYPYSLLFSVRYSINCVR